MSETKCRKCGETCVTMTLEAFACDNCGDEYRTVREPGYTQLETDLADKDRQLAEARAEIERKDKLIEQMREIINDYRIEHKAWCNHDPDNAKECTCGLSEKVKAALSAAERGERK